MYVGGPLDTAPATPSSTLSRSQASHREVKVRKVNPSHSVSPPALEYREVGRIATGTGLQGLDRPEGNYHPLSLSLSLFRFLSFSFSLRFSSSLYVYGTHARLGFDTFVPMRSPRPTTGDRSRTGQVHAFRFSTECSMLARQPRAASCRPNFKLNAIRTA